MVPHSKCGLRASGARVRIPPSPFTLSLVEGFTLSVVEGFTLSVVERFTLSE